MSREEFGKRLWSLFVLSVAAAVIGLVLPEKGQDVADLICMLVYGGILMSLVGVNPHYRTAGLCCMIAAAVNAVGDLVFPGSTGWQLLFLLPAVVLGLYGDFREFYAHADAVEEQDRTLAEQWRKLWKWNLLAAGAVVLGVLTILIVIGVIITAVAAMATLVLAILKFIYLYKTAKLIREYVPA